jgi:hypothetical protein
MPPSPLAGPRIAWLCLLGALKGLPLPRPAATRLGQRLAHAGPPASAAISAVNNAPGPSPRAHHHPNAPRRAAGAGIAAPQAARSVSLDPPNRLWGPAALPSPARAAALSQGLQHTPQPLPQPPAERPATDLSLIEPPRPPHASQDLYCNPTAPSSSHPEPAPAPAKARQPCFCGPGRAPPPHRPPDIRATAPARRHPAALRPHSTPQQPSRPRRV